MEDVTMKSIPQTVILTLRIDDGCNACLLDGITRLALLASKRQRNMDPIRTGGLWSRSCGLA